MPLNDLTREGFDPGAVFQRGKVFKDPHPNVARYHPRENGSRKRLLR